MKKFVLAVIVSLVGLAANAQELKEQEPNLNTRYVLYKCISDSYNFVLDSTTGELWYFGIDTNVEKLKSVKISGFTPVDENVKYFGRYYITFYKYTTLHYYLFDTYTGKIWLGRVGKNFMQEIDYKVDFAKDIAGEK